jgi:Tetratricopeptide repeat.
MNYQEKMQEINKMMKEKKFDEAEKELKNIIEKSSIKNVEDETHTHICFENYIQFLLYYHKNKPSKPNKHPEFSISQAYYFLGYINIELGKHEDALEYLNNALKWNPTDPLIIFEKATIFRETKKWDRFRAEVEKAYPHIYTSATLARYYRDLGFYYIERELYDIANALYTYSGGYYKTEGALNELKYIAQKENREPKFSTKEEIDKLFEEYNISRGFNKDTFRQIYDEYKEKLKKDEKKEIIILANVLYDMTLDENFICNKYTNELIGFEIKVSKQWILLEKEKYPEFKLDEKTLFHFSFDKDTSVDSADILYEKCSSEEFENLYKLDIENFKKEGIKIINESTINGSGKDIKQVIIEIDSGDKKSINVQNYFMFNNYLLKIKCNISDEEYNNELEKILNNVTVQKMMSLTYSMKDLQIKDENINTNNTSASESKEEGLQLYTQEMNDYPTFKFYFPRELGKQVKIQNNIFQIEKDKKQMVRVMVIKCSEESELEEKAKSWIERTRLANNQEIEKYEVEKIEGLTVHTYVLGAKKLISKIYKMVYMEG